ncbi:MAG TPA: M48 family metallopeptidase [Gammaproteobacteria bacterium]|nr:M48 family metallopeptidase [Gammaproteobacteria bacterium]
MDFFTRQEESRRSTRFLVVAFAAAFLAVVAATTAAVALVLRFSSDQGYATAQTWSDWVAANGALLGVVAVGTLALILLASGYRTASLSSGGGQVARLLGATPVTADVGDRARKRLVDVVEEMSIASGLPMPEIYVLEHEDGINAFASGLTTTDAAVTVTRGALERLNRAELQGVIAHEFSHILNGDMRLNQRLIGLCFGILVLSLVGRWVLRASSYGRFGGYGRRRDGRGVAAIVVLGLALTVIGAIGLLATRLIKAAVSRRRESLADASAVQFTRDPTGLAGALKKIGGYTSRLTSVESEEVSHMLFEHGGLGFGGWFATHPPLVERIRALDPSFRPEDFERAESPIAPIEEGAAEAVGLAPRAQAGGEASASGTREPRDARTLRVADADDAARLLGRAGVIESPELGGALRAALPEELHAAAHSRESSMLLVLALALSPDDAVRRQQAALLESRLGHARAERCIELQLALQAVDPKLRIPVLELCVPALKQRPAQHLEFLFDLVERLTELEPDKRLFDFVLLRMLAAYLARSPRAAPGIGASDRLSAPDAAAALLAAVAAYGQKTADSARDAYRAGVEAAGLRSSADPGFADLGALRDLARLDASLARLAKIAPGDKRRVLAGVLATIRHDRVLDVDEIELFRAIAATLGTPVPPFATLTEA